MKYTFSNVSYWHEADKAVELKVGNERKTDIMVKR